MIEFPCRCSFVFRLPDDMAGTMVQCPQCRLLNDVPTLSDLLSISPDGTYKLDDEPRPATPADEFLSTTQRTFSKDRVDEQGLEIDLRPTPEQIVNVGSDEIPLVDDAPPARPRYDPETGELIKPIPVQGEKPTPPIPVARQALNYASAAHMGVHPGIFRLLLELFMPHNLTVFVFVLFGHAVMLATLILAMMGAFILQPLWLLVLAMIVAHFVSVIDETGPTGSDELPRPLRNLGWHEDLWGPFRAGAVALLLAYGPATLLGAAIEQLGVHAPLSTLVTLAVGTFLLPAVLLTTATSGSFRNLRPDRVLSVLWQCSFRYLVAVLLAGIGIVLWIPGIVLTTNQVLHFMNKGASATAATPLLSTIAPLPLLIAGIFLLHLFGWYLGMLYRRHQAQFPWIFQRHTPDLSRIQAIRLARQEAQRARARQQPGSDSTPKSH